VRFVRNVVLTAIFGATLHATTVQYNTTGSFAGGFATSVSDFVNFTDGTGGIATITFDFDLSDSATSTGSPTSANFGTFVATVNNSDTITIPLTAFTLTINQTSPGSNDGPLVISGFLSSGTISQGSSTVSVTFSPNSGNIDDTTVPGTASYALNTASILPQTSGSSTLTGTVTYTAQGEGEAPEPATFALMGGGLMALGLVARRKR